MIRLDDFSGCPFSSADLYVVCEKYATGLVSSADLVLLDFEPSESGRTIVRRLMEKSLHKARRHGFYRRLVAVATVIIILFSTVLVTNAHAREVVVRWLRQIFPEFVFYQFLGETPGESHHYVVGWMPDGFEQVDYGEAQGEEYYIFMNGEEGIIIDFLDMGRLDELTLSGYTDYTLTDTTLNGFEAVIYQDNNSSDVDIVIFDTVNNVAISINSNMDLSTVLTIIESIKIE